MPAAAAIIGGAVISGVMGNQAAKKGANATRAAADASIAEQRRQFDLVRGDTAPYREVGQGALNQLAGLTGLPGFDGGERRLVGSEQEELATLNALAQGKPPSGSAEEMARLEQEIAGQAKHADSLGSDAPVGSGDDLAAMRARLSEMQGREATLTDAQRQRLEYLQGISTQPQTEQTARTPTEILEATPGYQFRLSESEKALQRMQSARGMALGPRAAKELGRYVSDYASGEYGNYLESLFRLSGLGGNAVNTSANAGANAAAGIGSANQFAGAGAANAAFAGGQATNNAIQGGLSNWMTLKAYNDSLLRTQFNGVGASPY